MEGYLGLKDESLAAEDYGYSNDELSDRVATRRVS